MRKWLKQNGAVFTDENNKDEKEEKKESKKELDKIIAASKQA